MHPHQHGIDIGAEIGRRVADSARDGQVTSRIGRGKESPPPPARAYRDARPTNVSIGIGTLTPSALAQQLRLAGADRADEQAVRAYAVLGALFAGYARADRIDVVSAPIVC